MKIHITFKKLLCIFLALVLISQSGVFAFAQNDLGEMLRQNSRELSAVDAAIEHSRAANPYENALILETEAQINKIQQSSSAQKLAALKKTGQEKYGTFWPAYMRAAGAKDLNILLTDLKTYLAVYYTDLKVMPFDMFEKAYKAEVEKAVKSSGANTNALAEVLKQYPAKSAYSAYKEQAQQEIAWRKANGTKVDAAAYKVIREYLKAIPLKALDSESLTLLNGMVLNNKPVLTSAEKEQAGKYHIAYINRQELKGLDSGLFKDKAKQKTAKFTLSEITESILSGAVTAGSTAEYGKAVQNLIYRSEGTGVFSELLAIGFGALVSVGQWPYVEGVLSRYSKQELEGPAWYEYMDISHYSKAYQNRNGKYLGKVSAQTEYNSEYGYHNVFTDMARILGEEGSSNALGLLYRYGSGRDNESVIKPFKAGALLSKKSGLKEDAASKQALIFANTEFGDITATEEYDLDKGLLKRYPAIKKELSGAAVVDDKSLAAKKSRQEVYGYLNRAAVSGDMILAVWGAAGLFKMGVKSVSLTRSAYTTLKAARITNRSAKLAFIRANYTNIKPYVSARRSILKTVSAIKAFLSKKPSFKNPVKSAKIIKGDFTPAPVPAPAAAVSAVKPSAAVVPLTDGNSLGYLNKYRLLNYGNSVDENYVIAVGGKKRTGKVATKIYNTLLPKRLKENKPFMPEVARTPFNPESAVFKIAPIGTGGGLGSGYYITKGKLSLPLIFTAGHVLKDSKFAQIRDINGFYTTGRVININRTNGIDLAAILVDDLNFLKGRTPFVLGKSTPRLGETLTAYSYPGGGFYRPSYLNLWNDKFLNGNNTFSYLTSPGTIEPGSSGGVVTLGDFNGTAVGTVMSMLVDKPTRVLLIPLDYMRKFYHETVKKLLFQPALRNIYLEQLPGLKNYYSNILANLSGVRIKSSTVLPEEAPISQIKDYRMLSLTQPMTPRELLTSAVFRVEGGNNSFGTASYVNYRGFNMLITAGHVIEDQNAVSVISPSGAVSAADVFSLSPASGRDLAILIPKQENFLSGYTPLTLSRKAPVIGMQLFSAGFQNEKFTFKAHKLIYDRFYIGHRLRAGSINHTDGLYASSVATGPGNSGGPFISSDGTLFGISNSIVPSRDLSLAVRYAVVKDFIRQSLVNKFMDPHFNFDAFTAKYPALGRTYANVIARYKDISGAESLKAYEAHQMPLTPGYAAESGVMPVSGTLPASVSDAPSVALKPMADWKKNSLFWLKTRLLGQNPKTVLKDLYAKGALPRSYTPLQYTGESYYLPSLSSYIPTIGEPSALPAFPFTDVKAYAHRGMSLSEEELVNIMDNGLRISDMPSQSLAILAPQVTPGTEVKAISFSKNPAVSAKYAAISLTDKKPLPVMVDVKGINSKTAAVNAHGMFTSKDIPADRIAHYNVLLNIEGTPKWGALTRSQQGGFIFKPYRGIFSSSPVKAAAPSGPVLSFPKAAYTFKGHSTAEAPAELVVKTSARHAPSATEIKTIGLVNTGDGIARSVWAGRNAENKIIAYLKYGTEWEVKRTVQIDEIVKRLGLREKYNLVDFDYPFVLAKNAAEMPADVASALQGELRALRAKNPRFFFYDSPFAVSEIDTSGLMFYRLYANDIKLLNGVPITDAEWKQIVGFYKDLNNAGFYHTDIFHNLYIRRTPSGKLKVSLLDFEFYSDNINDMHDLSVFEQRLINLGLKEDKITSVYYN